MIRPIEWLVSSAVGILGFGYRLLAHRGLTNDHYMHLAWARQILAGELPGRDFVDPGMPLMYLLSAAVQHRWPGPFSEAALCSALLGVAAVATCLAATRLTRSIGWGVVAALLTIALEPRLYSYPKILVPGVTLTVLAWYVRRPAGTRIAALAIWTSVAALLRYDLGLYAAISIGFALAIVSDGARARIRVVTLYAASTALAFAPWALAVARLEGFAQHIHETLDFTRGEMTQREFEWPTLGGSAGALITSTNTLALFVYLAYVLPVAGAVRLWFERHTLSRAERALAAAITAMAAMYLWLILRHPLQVRVRDVAGTTAVLAAWLAARPRSFAGRVGIGVVVAVVATATWTFGEVRDRLGDTHVANGWAKVTEVATAMQRQGTVEWPWAHYWPAGPIPDVVLYVDACTQSTARLFVTWSAPEYYFFARRAFAGGHAVLAPPDSFNHEADQRRIAARLAAHPPSIVLINETRRLDFASRYALVDTFLRAHFHAVGTMQTREGDRVTIAILNGITARGTYGSQRWPCVLSPAEPIAMGTATTPAPGTG